MNSKSRGHVEFVGDDEFYKLDKQLFRAAVKQPIGQDGRRAGQFVTAGSGIEFALRMARLLAGQAER